MKNILKPIFEMITGEYILFDNVVQNYIAMAIIGAIAYYTAKEFVGYLYHSKVIFGEEMGSIIHWTIRTIVFSTIFYILVGVLWITKFVIKYKNIILCAIVLLILLYIIWKIIKHKLLHKLNWKIIWKRALAVAKVIIFITILIFALKWIIDKIIFYKKVWNISNNTLLGVCATILSGAVTIFGVWLTIRHENKIKREDDLIKYKPILEFCGINRHEMCIVREVQLGMPFYSSHNDEQREAKENRFNKQMENKTKFRLLVQNKGRGETFNTVIDRFEIVSTNWDDNNTSIISASAIGQYVGEILIDGYLGIDIGLPNYLFMPLDNKGRGYNLLMTKLFINYSDMFNGIKYQYEINVSFKVEVEKFEEEQPYFYKEGYKYAKVRYNLCEIMPLKRIYSSKDKKYLMLEQYMTNK